MTSAPAFGLLLDVDGPIASPIDRAIIQPSIVPDIIALLSAGVPIVFNTGRSDEFLRHQVVEPLLEAGLPSQGRMHGVCEKGAVWFGIDGHGIGEIRIDDELSVPDEVGQRIEALVAEKYSDYMFYDHTKRAMVSVEQHLNVDNRAYREQQKHFDQDVFDLFQALGIGVSLEGESAPDSDGQIGFRIDPTIISTDIESIVLGKDRGAERALELLSLDGVMPLAWRTVGDSRTDYAMADWLNAQGHAVKHIDVRPSDGILERPFPVLTPLAGSVNDIAGAAYLNWVRRVVVDGSNANEEDFDLS